MTPGDRYDTTGLPEAQFEPGSHNQVLRNRLGITSQQIMDNTETSALVKALDILVRRFNENHQFTASDLCDCHRIWLGDIYAWAGNYRQMNVSKNDFLFSAAAHIPSLMKQFERDVLACLTPCRFPTRQEVLRALAETHVELVLIHPFRDGNGRLGRLISTLMALQAGLPLLHFHLLTGEKKGAYFGGIQAGMDKTYAPMEQLFAEIIAENLSAS